MFVTGSTAVCSDCLGRVCSSVGTAEGDGGDAKAGQHLPHLHPCSRAAGRHSRATEAERLQVRPNQLVVVTYMRYLLSRPPWPAGPQWRTS